MRVTTSLFTLLFSYALHAQKVQAPATTSVGFRAENP